MKPHLIIIVIASIFSSCNKFEYKFYDKIDIAQKNAIEKNSPVIFDLNDVTDFDWIKMLHITGNESMPIHNFEIEPILGRQTKDLKTWKNRFYFLNSKNEIIVKDIDYQHYPSYSIEFCLKDSIKNIGYQWLSKDECKFTLVPNTKKAGTGMVFLFPVCNTKFDKDNFGIFRKQEIKLSIPKNVDSDFKIFLNFFNKDSTFQISRVKFPLKIKDLNEDFELRERTINKEEYYLKKFDFNEINKLEVFNEYKQRISVNENNVLIEINGIENGIACEFYFKKINNKWKLVSWIDQST